MEVFGDHSRGRVAAAGGGADDGVIDGQSALTLQRLDGHAQVVELRVLHNTDKAGILITSSHWQVRLATGIMQAEIIIISLMQPWLLAHPAC